MQGTAMVRRVQTLGREQTSERRSLGEAHLAEVAQLEAQLNSGQWEVSSRRDKRQARSPSASFSAACAQRAVR